MIFPFVFTFRTGFGLEPGAKDPGNIEVDGLDPCVPSKISWKVYGMNCYLFHHGHGKNNTFFLKNTKFSKI